MWHTPARTLVLTSAFCAAASIGPQAQRLQPAATPALLLLGTPTEATLRAGQANRYRLEVQPGDFLSLTVEQLGVDVAVSLLAPNGEALVSLNAMDDEFRPERLLTIVEDGGPVIAQVQGASSAAAGPYRIRLDAVRAPTDADRRLTGAEDAFVRGRKVRDAARAATWPEALREFTTAFEAFTAANDGIGRAKSRLEIGITENYLSRPEALESADEAVRLTRAAGDLAATARALRLAGNIMVARGDYAGAVSRLDEAVSVSDDIAHRNSAARSLNDAAIAYRRSGNVEHAAELYERALTLARETRDGTMEGNILNNLGVAYKTLGDYDRALDLFERSLAHRLAAKDIRAQFHAYINLANMRRRLGQYPQALEMADAALAISRTTGDKVREAAALNARGQVQHALAEHDAAVESHRAALTLARETPDLDNESMALSALGRALNGLGREDEAAAVLHEALALSRRMHFTFGERDDLADLAIVERARGDLPKAEEYIAQSVALDESLRNGITSPELRASFVAAEQDRYELFIDILSRRHQQDPQAGHAGRALLVSERARARVLLDSILDGGVDLREGVAADLRERERTLQKQIQGASEQLSEALASGKADRPDGPLGARVETLLTSYEQLRAEIRRRSPRYADITQPAPLTVAEIQHSVLDADTVLLEYALGEERSWLWAATPNSLTMHSLPPRTEIEGASRALLLTLTARQPRRGECAAARSKRIGAADARATRESAAVSRMLLGPIAASLAGEWAGKRIAIVTAGVLDTVPFVALPIGAASAGTPARTPKGADLLGLRHPVVRLPSASVLAAMRRETRATPRKILAILADPVFERSDPRVATRGTSTASTPAPMARVAAHALGRAAVGRLPFSREEADGIAALAPAASVFKAVDFDANRDVALGTALRDYRIVHFATHGVFDSERPALSGLVLSLLSANGRARDGYLRLQDIYNAQLNAELVVLSACQTALGKEVRGEGLVSIARAFMYAGAPRTVASLWQVNDLATAELMTRFYRGMLKEGRPASDALRAAQQGMQADPRWKSPYYWAGFTLVGEWR